MDKVWSSKYTLAQFTNVWKKKKNCFKVGSDHSISLTTLSFLSFHKVHIKHRGATLHAFSLCLLTKAPCRLSKFLLIEECKTHCTPKKRENQTPKHCSLLTKKNQVVTGFLFLFSQVTPIRHIPSPCSHKVFCLSFHLAS